jgi:hypothetical protein
MDTANRFADVEDACNNKRTRSPEDDRRNRYGSQRRRSKTMTPMAHTAKSPQDIKTTTIKEMIAEARDIEATERRTTRSFLQENPENTTHR